ARKRPGGADGAPAPMPAANCRHRSCLGASRGRRDAIDWPTADAKSCCLRGRSRCIAVMQSDARLTERRCDGARVGTVGDPGRDVMTLRRASHVCAAALFLAAASSGASEEWAYKAYQPFDLPNGIVVSPVTYTGYYEAAREVEDATR